MSAETGHPVFLSPDDPNIKVWRYLDFTKYVSLLETRSLYFSRSDRLGDPFEGSLSRANPRLRPLMYKDSPLPSTVFERMAKLYLLLMGEVTDRVEELQIIFSTGAEGEDWTKRDAEISKPALKDRDNGKDAKA